MLIRRRRKVWQCATAWFLLCGWANAAGDANFSGVVLQPDGNPAPFAAVTIIQAAGDFHRETQADAAGKFQFSQVPPGRYAVSAQSAGGGGAARTTAALPVNKPLDVTLRLSSQWAAFEDGDPRSDWPNRGNYLDTIRNTTEVTRGAEGGNLEGYTVYATRGNSALNVVGLRAQDNTFQIDGLDNNESWLRGPIVTSTADSMAGIGFAEVYLPADTGHAAGGSVNVQTRAGSNGFHGSAFDYLQNSAVNSRNFFDGAQKPGLVQNQFGATLGGPISGKGWFFFVDLEAQRNRQGLTVISTVPTAAQKAGIFGNTAIYDPLSITEIGENVYGRSQFPGNQIPASRLPVPVQRLLALYPDPNLRGAADNYRFAPSLIDNSARVDGRTDKILSPRQTLMARASYERNNQQSPGALPFAASDPVQHADDAKTLVRAWEGGVSHTFVIHPEWINQFKASVARLDLGAYANDRGVNAAAALGIPGLGSDGLPAVAPLGFTALGAAEPVPLQIRTTNYQAANTVVWKTARHTWELGAQVIRRHADGSAADWTSRGSFLFTPDYTSYPGAPLTGDSIASLLLGFPTEVRRDVQLTPFQLRGWEWAGFVQDEFRIGRNLMVQAGLRYSLDPPVTEASDHLVNFNYDRVAPALNQFAGQAGVNAYGGLNFNKKTWAPRVGFAWDVWGTGATVLRGGVQ